MFEVSGYTSCSDPTVYGQERLAGVGFVILVDCPMEFETIDDVVPRLMEFCGVTDKERVTFDKDGEVGRIDIVVIENHYSNAASVAELAAWKKGGRNKLLWETTYTFRVSQVERQVADMRLWNEKQNG